MKWQIVFCRLQAGRLVPEIGFPVAEKYLCQVMRLLPVIILILILCKQPTAAQTGSFDYSPACHAAYQQFMSLNPSAGRQLLRQERQEQPRNLIPVYLENYEDCLLLLLNGDPREYERRKKNLDLRIRALEQGDSRSPWFRFSKANIYLHWALIQGRFGDNLKAALSFRRSYLLVRENQKLFPDFAPNQILLGIHDAVIGTIPSDYQWIASVLGMKGNVRRGIGHLAGYLNHTKTQDPLRAEAAIYYAYLRYYLLSEQEDVWAFVNSSLFEIRGNLLNAFVRANLALNYRKAEAAVQALKQMANSPYYSEYPIFDFEMGTALHLQLDPEQVFYHTRFLKNYRGGLFVRDALQQLSLHNYLQGNVEKAHYYRSQILKQGNKVTDADKQASRFAAGTTWPAIPVLKARLLLDGGFYQKALDILRRTEVNSLETVTDRLEYYFRLARAYDVLGEHQKALAFYDAAINLGRERKEHFAARSALQAGLLLERQGNRKEAISKFRECLSMRDHDFQANIDQQAKAALNRLGSG